MQIIKCYSICVWNGGSSRNHKYYVSKKETAEDWVKANTYDEYSEVQFVILDNMDEVLSYEKEQLRKSALNKLSASEREALGL